MTALIIAVWGAGIGAGVLLVIRALRPRPVPLGRIGLNLNSLN